MAEQGERGAWSAASFSPAHLDSCPCQQPPGAVRGLLVSTRFILNKAGWSVKGFFFWLFFFLELDVLRVSKFIL